MPEEVWRVECEVGGDFDLNRTQRHIRYICPLHGGTRRFEVFLESGDVLGDIEVPEGSRRTDSIRQLLTETGGAPDDIEVGIIWGRLGERLNTIRSRGVTIEREVVNA